MRVSFRLFSFVVLFFSVSAQAQICPGNGPLSFMSGAYNTRFFKSISPAWVGPGACTVMKNFVNPTTMFPDCATQASAMGNVLAARFGTGYFSNTSKECVFTCPGGTCTIRGGDGLPVELMEFAIEETDTE